MQEAQLPDGTFAQLPDYALEATQEKILEYVKKMGVTDKATLKKFEQLLKASRDYEKTRSEQSDKQLDVSNKQLEALKAVRQASQKSSIFSLDTIRDGLFGAVKTVTGALSAIATPVVAVTTLMGRLTLNMGMYNAKLSKVGVGLTDQSMSSMVLMSRLNQLGLGVQEATKLMYDYSGAVQTAGRTTFAQMQKEFSLLTRRGSELGLTVEQAAEYIAEELETRKVLGYLSQLDANRAAKDAETLYKMQLKAAAALGLTIDEIRNSGKATLATNAQVRLSILATTKGLGAEMAQQLTNSVQTMSAEFKRLGISDELTNQITNEMFDVVSGYTEAGQELIGVLNTVGRGAGSALTGMIVQINQLKQQGRIPEMTALMSKVPGALAGVINNLSADDAAELAKILPALGEAGRQFALDLGAATEGAAKFHKGVGGTVEPIAQLSLQLNSAAKLIKGSFTSLFTSSTGVLAPALLAVANSFEDITVKGEKQAGIISIVSGIIQQAGSIIQNVLVKALGTNIENLNDVIRDKLITRITAYGSRILEFLKELEGMSFTEIFDHITKKAFGYDSNIVNETFENIKGIGQSLKKAADGVSNVIDHASRAFDRVMNLKWELLLGVPLAAILIKTITAATAKALAARTAASALPMATPNRRIPGAGLGAAGLAASAKALGIATLAAIGFATAIRIAGPYLEDFGVMSKDILVGFGTLITNTFNGIANIIGTSVEKISDGIMKIKTAGAQAQAVKLDATASSMERISALKGDNLLNLSEAIDHMSNSLSGFRDTVGKDGWIFSSGLDINKQNKQLAVFEHFSKLDAVKISANSMAVDRMAAAYTKIANLDHTALTQKAQAIKTFNNTAGTQLNNQQATAINVTTARTESRTQSIANLMAPIARPAAITTAPLVTREAAQEPVNQERTLDTRDLEAVLMNILSSSEQGNRLLRELQVAIREAM